jgi:diguanylate cyclase (GGDEF)-like protein
MPEKLRIMLCEHFEKEVIAVKPFLEAAEIYIGLYHSLCDHPQRSLNVIEKILKKVSDDEDMIFIGGCFLHGKNPLFEQKKNIKYQILNQCFQLFINLEFVDFLIEKGAYLMTPGWLSTWQKQFERWGFNQSTAQSFFQEFTRKLILLDTGVDQEAENNIRALSDYLNIPFEALPVGLSCFQNYLATIISDWRLEKSTKRVTDIQKQSKRLAADYAMALDLVTELSQIMNEEQASEKIITIFETLFAPGRILYIPVNGKKLGYIHSRPENNSYSTDQYLEFILNNDQEYFWTDDGQDFYIRFSCKKETMGILIMEGVIYPERRHEYITLTSIIARVCGLAIANSRTFQLLQNTETQLRKERDFSSTLRQAVYALTSTLELKQVLDQLLIYLRKVIPYDSASIFLVEENELLVVTGKGYLDADSIIGRRISMDESLFSYLQDTEKPLVIDDVSTDPLYKKWGENNLIHGWMGIPMHVRNKLIGYLSIDSFAIGDFTEEDANLAQVFANEAAVAIDNVRLFEEAQYLAISDPLTGLHNRRHFYKLAEGEFKRSLRYQRELSAIMFDIDHFKQVNDRYGHAVGDQVLTAIAQNCKKGIRSADIAGRYGGEEFVILLPETNLTKARQFAERLRKKLGNVIVESEKGPVSVTISMGVAALEFSCTSLNELLNRADHALYEAKNTGRNKTCVWE